MHTFVIFIYKNLGKSSKAVNMIADPLTILFLSFFWRFSYTNHWIGFSNYQCIFDTILCLRYLCKPNIVVLITVALDYTQDLFTLRLFRNRKNTRHILMVMTKYSLPAKMATILAMFCQNNRCLRTFYMHSTFIWSQNNPAFINCRPDIIRKIYPKEM